MLRVRFPARSEHVTRFLAREGVLATFDDLDLGVAEALDIGPFADPDQPGLQYYVFSHQARQDVVRFASRCRVAPRTGQLGSLTLQHDGAHYQVEALCTAVEPREDGRCALCFEAQHPPRVRASARERHGIDDLASALLLDALIDD